MAREECKVLNWYVFSQFRFLRLDDWNQIHFGRHIFWIPRRSHVLSWNFKVFWKLRTPADATASSEFVGDVLSRFRLSSWMTGTRSILATHFVGYLGALMSVLGNSECFRNFVLKRMRRPPQNMLAMSFRNFDFQVG